MKKTIEQTKTKVSFSTRYFSKIIFIYFYNKYRIKLNAKQREKKEKKKNKKEEESKKQIDLGLLNDLTPQTHQV